MAKEKTILRVVEGFELDEVLLGNVQKIVGEFTLERYSNSGNFLENYKRRADSLQKAFQCVIDKIPVKTFGKAEQDKEQLKGCLANYVKWCRESCVFTPEADITTCQDILGKYTSLLVSALYDHCDWSAIYQGKKINKTSFHAPANASTGQDYVQTEQQKRIELAAEILNKADQYVIMQEGRDDIVTLCPLDVKNVGDLVLMWDKKLPPCSPETLNDLEVIGQSPMLNTPHWFRNLPSYQQLYFHSIDSVDISLPNLKFALNTLLIKFKEIKIANQTTLEQDLKIIADDSKPLPQWYTSLSEAQQRTIKILASPANTLDKFENRLSQLNENIRVLVANRIENFSEEVTQLSKLPYWYLTLADYEQRFLKAHLKNAMEKKDYNLADAFSFLPSRLRTIPALANFTQHLLMILNKEGLISDELAARLRSSHLASRDVIKLLSQIAELHSQRNLATICKFVGERLLVLQTLISPEWTISYLMPSMPDYHLDLQRKLSIAWARRRLGASIVSTNHPYNYTRIYDYTTATNADCVEILGLVQTFISLRNLPELQGKWEFSQIEDLVATVASDFERELQNYEEQTTEENRIKAMLLSFFRANPDLLKRWPNGQKAVTEYLFALSQKESHQKNYLAYKQNLDDLAELAKDYQAVLNSGMGTASYWDYNGRELFLSTHEDLMATLAGGVCYGSCVSNKDRKWIEICHTNAAFIYHRAYGHWPKFTDTGAERANFVNITAGLYISRHGHVYAGQNGSEGIKTPDIYLPKDIAAAIKRLLNDPSALANDDLLASNIEVTEIYRTSSQIRPGFSNYIFSVLQLSKENRLTLLSELKILMGENQFWQKSLSYWASFYKYTPDGISKIKNHLQANDANSVGILAEIFYEVSQRPSNSSSRCEPTQEVYNCILGLFQADNPDSIFSDQIEKLKGIKKEAFSTNLQRV